MAKYVAATTTSGSDGGEVSRDARDIQSELTRAQWDDFQERFIPVENELLGMASTGNANQDADLAGNYVEKAYANTKSQLGRKQAGLGAGITNRQNSALERRRKLGLATSTANAENTTRRSSEERNINLMGEIMGIGKGINNSASDAAKTASGLATSRAQSNAQSAEASRQQMTSTVMQGAALMMMM